MVTATGGGRGRLPLALLGKPGNGTGKRDKSVSLSWGGGFDVHLSGACTGLAGEGQPREGASLGGLPGRAEMRKDADKCVVRSFAFISIALLSHALPSAKAGPCPEELAVRHAAQSIEAGKEMGGGDERAAGESNSWCPTAGREEAVCMRTDPSFIGTGGVGRGSAFPFSHSVTARDTHSDRLGAS